MRARARHARVWLCMRLQARERAHVREARAPMRSSVDAANALIHVSIACISRTIIINITRSILRSSGSVIIVFTVIDLFIGSWPLAAIPPLMGGKHLLGRLKQRRGSGHIFAGTGHAFGAPLAGASDGNKRTRRRTTRAMSNQPSDRGKRFKTDLTTDNLSNELDADETTGSG
jgi:hypothetical protein